MSDKAKIRRRLRCPQCVSLDNIKLWTASAWTQVVLSCDLDPSTQEAFFVVDPFNSGIFLSFYVQAFSEPSLKGLHRRHHLILGVGGDVEAVLGLPRIFK